MTCSGECDFLTMIYPLYFQFQSNITTGLLFGGQTNWIDPIPVPGFEDTDPIDDEVTILIVEGVLGFRPKGRRAYGPKKKFMVHAPSGIGVDIFTTDNQCWAIVLVVTTGGDTTNKSIATGAQKKGWRFRTSGDGFDTLNSHITCTTEREVFEAVGLPYLSPEQRE